MHRIMSGIARVLTIAVMLAACGGGSSDGPPAGGGNTGGTGAGNGGDGGNGGEGGALCTDGTTVSVTFDAAIPSIVLLVDQSATMADPFDAETTRWEAVRSALMDGDDGLVKGLESSVTFGLVLYTSFDGGPACPTLLKVAPALHNHAAMSALFSAAAPEDDSPTGDAIAAVSATLAALPAPRLILLATDGLPDTCAVPEPDLGHSHAIAAAQAASLAGVSLAVLTVGDLSSESHQQDMANAGAGLPVPASCPPCAPYYRPATRDDLAEDLRVIINGVRSCTFNLDVALSADQLDQATVTLNGHELVLGGDDGWQLETPTSIVLLGTACDDVMAGGEDVVNGTFPCEALSRPAD